MYDAANREKLTNCAHIYLRFEFNRDVWSGFPKLRFHIKGKLLYNPAFDSDPEIGGSGSHDLTDPDTWEYSDNWALANLDYILIGQK